MEALHQAIRERGRVLSEDILKVDNFLNHQIDTQLMAAVGQEFAKRFQDQSVTKVITLESSGIAPSFMAANTLDVPLVFARKKKALTGSEDVYTSRVYSYTKQELNQVIVSKEYLAEGDRVLIIDDFLAHGNAALGLTEVVEEAGATVVGVGAVIEKAFQEGRTQLEMEGYQVESLARIESLSNGEVTFIDEVVTNK
ncbi:xanthine phosphoribosyltransferase [Alkalibacillus almallahensis]|uniref:xanthine phosphoribosyltransferase n=1 Tax=Alkalibacillus almallahensis TaxID=1379154 RepID=UPI001423C513|nr:xanthine phosphoribosyltransferase [Alkalibacillus almallahensis]NIK11713.1 xanthine phosphoribosyltransferase [Alkalibacillus almallahensis]